MMNWYGTGGHMTVAGWLFMIFLIVTVLAALALLDYLIFRALGRPLGRDGDTARRTLDERFARGELDIDEYQRRRALLETGRRS